MKIAINKYYAIAGVLVILLVIFGISKNNTASDDLPSKASSQQADESRQDQPAANDATAKNIEEYVKDRLNKTPVLLLYSYYDGDSVKQQLSSEGTTYQIGEFVKKVSVSKADKGGYNVAIELSHPTQYGGSEKTMASLYVSLYKNDTGFDIRRISTSSYVIAKDKYGNRGDQLSATSSLSKEEASKYNWNLADEELVNLVSRNMNYNPLYMK